MNEAFQSQSRPKRGAQLWRLKVSLLGALLSIWPIGASYAGGVNNALIVKIEAYEGDVVFIYLDTAVGNPATCGVYTAAAAYRRFAIRPSEPFGMTMFALARTALTTGKRIDITGRGDYVGASSASACNIWSDTESVSNLYLHN